MLNLVCVDIYLLRIFCEVELFEREVPGVASSYLDKHFARFFVRVWVATARLQVKHVSDLKFSFRYDAHLVALRFAFNKEVVIFAEIVIIFSYK